MFTPVILSGGAGTRLWPLSRELYPKQLLALTEAHTLLQQTVLRLEGLGAAAPVIVCNEAHRFLVAEQLRALQVAPRATLLEPFGRNTAPAIALGAHAALKGVVAGAKAAGPVLLVLPADHLIRDTPAFQQAVRAALGAAQAGQLVTFGVVASRAETAYGYIQRGAASGEGFRIARFVEKPNRERAQELLHSGDYAVMEKTADAVVVPLKAGWSDVGSWAALHEASEADAHGNVVHGDVLCEDTH